MKKYVLIALSIVLLLSLSSCTETTKKETTIKETSQNQTSAEEKKVYNELSTEEKRVLLHKGTEKPFSGKYHDFFEKGYYHCKQCNARLYASNDKFKSDCGWPSFDDEIKGAIKRKTDADGRRTEILCANCDGHLGHVFKGEQFTAKNIRHCVNSVSLTFAPEKKELPPAKAYFAGGCFWGVEHLFEHKEGVLSAISGYMGGSLEKPSYKDICTGNTGHLEVVEITYQPTQVTYEELVKFFFEIHDPTQANGQGPDIGEQYLSAVFCESDEEKMIVQKLSDILHTKGFKIATKVLPVATFWKAEDYHQDYYEKKNKKPYCHAYKKKF